MESKRQHILNLKPTFRGGPLVARVVRTWDVVYNQSNPSSFDMLLYDEQGGLIVATVRRDLIQAYKDQISEGNIHTLNNFEVARNNKQHLPVKNDLIIRFTPYTTIFREQETQATIQDEVFMIHPLDRLNERNNKSDYSIDVVGLLTGVEEKTWVNVGANKSPIRRIYIEDPNNLKVTVTLWGPKADLIDIEKTKEITCKVVIITSTKVNMYQGRYQLNSTSATKIYFNKDIPESEGFKQRGDEMEPIKALQPHPHEPPEQAMFRNRKKLEDILQKDPGEKETFTCSAKITSIYLHKKWHYNSCDACKTKIDETSYCTKCDVVVKYPKIRYLLTVDIDDGSACVPLALFDKEAERVIGSPVNKLLDLQKKENGNEKVTERLQICIGKNFAFRVKLSTRSETTELICQRTFETNYQLEKSYEEQQHKDMASIKKEKGQDADIINAKNPTTVETGSQGSQVLDDSGEDTNIESQFLGEPTQTEEAENTTKKRNRNIVEEEQHDNPTAKK